MTLSPRIFAEAIPVLDHLLEGLESHASGLVTACHITGSIALGDGRPGQSDLDIILVRRPDAGNSETMAALMPVLVELRSTRPWPIIDGLVLSETDLELGPDHIEGERPVIVDHQARLGTDGSGRNPVTWQMLRQCGITYRGVRINPARLWHDPNRFDSWARENLESYWQPWLSRADGLISRRGAATLTAEPTEWGVLGVTRLHYTLATGEVTSKLGAGLYALDTFAQRWHPIIEEALRIRERRGHPPRYRTSLGRHRAMRDYVDMVIDSALALPMPTDTSALNSGASSHPEGAQ